MSRRSELRILSIKVDCTFLFSNFLVTGLCNFSANSLLEIFHYYLFGLKMFYQKIYEILNQVHVDIHRISFF